jgi:hypothetical protein
MLDPLRDTQTDRDGDAFGVTRATSGRYASDSPTTKRRHSVFWWLLVAVAFII